MYKNQVKSNDKVSVVFSTKIMHVLKPSELTEEFRQALSVAAFRLASVSNLL